MKWHKHHASGKGVRREWPTLIVVAASAAAFVALDGTAGAAGGLMKARDIATGAVTSPKIKDGAVMLKDLNPSTMRAMHGAAGDAGKSGGGGNNGANGAHGLSGADGRIGSNGVNGNTGTTGTSGTNGANGPNGLNGLDGRAGTDGDDAVNGSPGVDGIDGDDGIDGIDGDDGTVTPRSASSGAVDLPTAAPPVSVVELDVPAGRYVVMAKTQLDHTGAGDSVTCTLRAGATTLDSAAMKTLLALAAVPVSLVAVATVTTTPTRVSLACSVSVANGHANFSQLVVIPTA